LALRGATERYVVAGISCEPRSGESIEGAKRPILRGAEREPLERRSRDLL
jgi:hypothetical protein